MKHKTSRRTFVLSALAGIGLLSCVSHAATIVIGTGDVSSYLVLESGNLGVRNYEIRYDSSSGPHDSKFLLDQALIGDTSLTMAFTNYGTPSAPNFIMDSITRNSVTEANSFSPPFVYWVQWVAGGDAGYPSATPVPSGTWSFGSGMSSPYRLIAPGSWDAFVFSDGSAPPSVAPVPEPSALVMLPIGTLLILRRRK